MSELLSLFEPRFQAIARKQWPKVRELESTIFGLVREQISERDGELISVPADCADYPLQQLGSKIGSLVAT